MSEDRLDQHCMSVAEYLAQHPRAPPELSARALENGSHRLLRKVCEKVLHETRGRLSELAEVLDESKDSLLDYFKKRTEEREELARLRGKVSEWLLLSLMNLAPDQLARISRSLASTFMHCDSTRIVISQHPDSQPDPPEPLFSHFYLLAPRAWPAPAQAASPWRMLLPLPVRLSWLGEQHEGLLNWDIDRPEQTLPFELRRFVLDLLRHPLVPVPPLHIEDLVKEALPHIAEDLLLKRQLYDSRHVLMSFSLVDTPADREGLVWARLEAGGYRQDIEFNILQTELSVEDFVVQLSTENALQDCEGQLADQLRKAIFDDLERRMEGLRRLHEELPWQKEKLLNHSASLRRSVYNGCAVQFPKTSELAEGKQTEIDWKLANLMEQYRDLLPAGYPSKKLDQQGASLLLSQYGLSPELNEYIPAELRSKLRGDDYY